MDAAIAELQDTLHDILAAHPAGLSEYDLLKALASRDIGMFGDVDFGDPHALFQRHFLLFHCLYLLRDRMRNSGAEDLHIHCMDIRIMPCGGDHSGLPAEPDLLAGYYRDLENLKATGRADVVRMLDDFWNRYAGFEQRDEALAVMELDPSASYPDIRRQYRRLAMRWHPDRGGDPERFQRLEWAMGVLQSRP